MPSRNQSTNSNIGITIIAAMTQDLVIGKDSKMPWHISEELKNFKKLTMGRPMIMGRTTYDSLGRRALPGRKSIVLSSDHNLPLSDNCYLANNLEVALQIAIDTGSNEVMIIGGATVYQQFLPLANKLLLSFVHKDYSGDTFFPAYDAAQWQQIANTDFAEFTTIELIRNVDCDLS
ncbi:MAG: dihydrofolate reductase [Francisellaceae bacterium]|nr:dihydrofolate reductase [Francisellaceae bacterium]MBT6207114.1 dihydrofolate reductase [Francisellaceae bacterium]MBT6539907.1 dihydrofolate reductase [Francisellaceae bacterium]